MARLPRGPERPRRELELWLALSAPLIATKGYATPEHQRAIRELGPCPIHRRSFDYIRELRGEYCELYYDLKNRGYACVSRSSLSLWESEMKAAEPNLSVNENKKLHLLATRLWKRLSTTP